MEVMKMDNKITAFEKQVLSKLDDLIAKAEALKELVHPTQPDLFELSEEEALDIYNQEDVQRILIEIN